MAISPKPSTLSSQPLAPRLSAPLVVTLSYMCVLFILSSIPDTGENGHLMDLASSTAKNMLHAPAYGLLALLWIFTLRDHAVTEHRSMCVAFLVASGYGALTELNQVWVPGRFPSASDVMFDVVGSLIFIWLYWWVSGESSVESRVSKVESKEGALTSKLSTSS
jgi:hypothetical protein